MPQELEICDLFEMTPTGFLLETGASGSLGLIEINHSSGVK